MSELFGQEEVSPETGEQGRVISGSKNVKGLGFRGFLAPSSKVPGWRLEVWGSGCGPLLLLHDKKSNCYRRSLIDTGSNHRQLDSVHRVASYTHPEIPIPLDYGIYLK